MWQRAQENIEVAPGYRRWPTGGPPPPPKRRWLTLVLGALCACCVVAALWFYRRAPAPPPRTESSTLIVDARAAGQYARAQELLTEALRNQPGSPELQALSSAFQQNLNPIVEMRYLSGGLMPERKPDPEAPIQLSPDDEFYYKLDLRNMPRESYVYMFLVDSAGKWTVLLPNAGQVSNGNPLQRADYEVPEIVKQRLKPAATPGVEKVFFVQAYWRIEALEELAAQLAVEKDPGRAGGLGQRLLARLRLEEAAAPGIPGLGFGSMEFHSTGTK